MSEKKFIGKPLTLEQLREMDGQPVWCKSLINGKSEWAIVRIIKMSKTWFVALSGASQGFGDKDTYEKTWLAYARKPLCIDHEAWEPCDVCRGVKFMQGWASGVSHFDGFSECETKVEGDFNFCPECGKPLRKEAWDMLKKRLGGQKNDW